MQALTPKTVKTFDHEPALTAARYSPCGKFLFALGLDSRIVRWDLSNDAKIELAGHAGWLQGLVFLPDSQQMITGDSFGRLRCWNYAEAAPTPLWSVETAHSKWMRNMALSPDGSTLATCGADKHVRLWATTDGALKQDLGIQEQDLFSVAFHPSGTALVWGDLFGRATHWDLAAGKVARVLDASVLYLHPMVKGVPEINDVGGIRQLAFDPQGTQLACAGTQPMSSGFVQGKPTVLVFDWESGTVKQQLQLADAVGDDGFAVDLAWHPDGYWMIVCSGQSGPKAVWFWKLGEQTPFYLNREMPHCRSLSLHPDGKQLAVARVAIKPGAITGNVALGKKADYPGQVSFVHILDLTATA